MGASYIREHWKYLTTTGLYPGVDLLRALAVSLVLLYHFQFFRAGWVGVDLFFVISGFLIGGAIIDKAMAGRFSFVDFYRNRALRILPIYYFITFLSVVLKTPGKPFDGVALKSLLSGALFVWTTGKFFLPDFFVLNMDYIVGGSWSLVIEEVFYLVAPLGLLLLVKWTRRRLAAVVALVVMAALAGILIRTRMTLPFPTGDGDLFYSNFIQFHSRYDELAAGIAAAGVVRLLRNTRAHAEWFLVVAAALIWVFFSYIYAKPQFLNQPWKIAEDTIWLPTLFGAGGASLLLSMYWLNTKSKAVILLARLSYPLYLVHILYLETISPYAGQGVLGWMGKAFGFDGRNVASIFICIALSYLASLLVEYPFIRMYKGERAKLVKAKTAVIAT